MGSSLPDSSPSTVSTDMSTSLRLELSRTDRSGYLMPTRLKLTWFLGLYRSWHLMDAREKTPGLGPAFSISRRLVSASFSDTTSSFTDFLFNTLILGKRLRRTWVMCVSERWLKDLPAAEDNPLY